MRIRVLALPLLISACVAKLPASEEAAHAEPASPVAHAPAAHGHEGCPNAAEGHACDPAGTAQPVSGCTFGRPFDPALPRTTLATLRADPAAYVDREVHVTGKVHRVCQRMGCWMELADDTHEGVVRAPMSGHAFFLPKDCEGEPVEVQGRVRLRTLTDAQRAHLGGEGATETNEALEIEALGVVLTAR